MNQRHLHHPDGGTWCQRGPAHGGITIPVCVECHANAMHHRSSQLAEAQRKLDAIRELTYASDDGSEFEHDHGRMEGYPECPACWADGILAILDGTNQ